MNYVRTFEYKGYSVKIAFDNDVQGPDTWGNQSVFVVYDHRQFTVKVDGFHPRDIFERTQLTKRMTFDGYHVFPLYAYIHSGVALSLGRDGYPFSDRWDVSSTGFVLVKRERGSWTRSQAFKLADGIVSTWNSVLSGEVYGYIVEDSAGNEVDSCWGFIGDIEYCMNEARSIVDYRTKVKNEKA